MRDPANNRRAIVIHDYWGDHMQVWLQNLVNHYAGQGYGVRVWNRQSLQCIGLKPLKKEYKGAKGLLSRILTRRALKYVQHVYIWNGQHDYHRILIRSAESLQIPVTYLEVGYFPQGLFYVMDSKGINATASLMSSDLAWIDDGHLRALESMRETYLQGRTWVGGGGYTLIPLQLDRDTNVRDHADFENMQEFIDHCESTLEGPLLFKTHPLDHGIYHSQHKIVTEGSFLELAERCDCVVGLNSTCLLESALMGVPTQALGRGFLQVHGDRVERLLAALVDRQVPVEATDISSWIERFSSERSGACDSA